MAEIIRVTPAQLKAEAENLRSLNTQMKGKVDILVTSEQNLVSMWEGQDRDAFDKAFNNDKDQWAAFNDLIEKYVGTLLEIVAKYEESERMNTDIASNRSY